MQILSIHNPSGNDKPLPEIIVFQVIDPHLARPCGGVDEFAFTYIYADMRNGLPAGCFKKNEIGRLQFRGGNSLTKSRLIQRGPGQTDVELPVDGGNESGAINAIS